MSTVPAQTPAAALSKTAARLAPKTAIDSWAVWAKANPPVLPDLDADKEVWTRLVDSDGALIFQSPKTGAVCPSLAAGTKWRELGSEKVQTITEGNGSAAAIEPMPADINYGVAPEPPSADLQDEVIRAAIESEQPAQVIVSLAPDGELQKQFPDGGTAEITSGANKVEFHCVKTTPLVVNRGPDAPTVHMPWGAIQEAEAALAEVISSSARPGTARPRARPRAGYCGGAEVCGV